MTRFVASRIVFLIGVLLGMSVLAFTVSHIIPGDPARAAAGPEAGPEQVEAVRREYRLDRPIVEQYLYYMSRLVRGDLGISIMTRRPVRDDLGTYFPATIELAFAASFIAVVLGIPLGVAAATRCGKWLDHVSRLASLVGAAAPVFWSGLLLQLVFYRNLGWFPATGRLRDVSGVSAITGFYTLDALLRGDFALWLDALHHLVLPAVTLAQFPLALLTRMVRSSMVEVLREDLVRTARGKGLREGVVVWKHAFRNALIPVATVFGLQCGRLLGGAVVTEVIFSWPGLGFYAVRAVTSLDFPAVMGVALLMGFVFVVVNLFVDISYLLLDPRIRY